MAAACWLDLAWKELILAEYWTLLALSEARCPNSSSREQVASAGTKKRIFQDRDKICETNVTLRLIIIKIWICRHSGTTSGASWFDILRGRLLGRCDVAPLLCQSKKGCEGLQLRGDGRKLPEPHDVQSGLVLRRIFCRVDSQWLARIGREPPPHVGG